MSDDELRTLTLAGIAQRCARESDHFFNRRDHDPRYCFELFRRAIVERQQHAWTLVCEQYRPLVAGWVKRHAAFRDSDEEIAYFVNGAYAKMWSAMSPQKFADFTDLKSLLRYLQLCVSSVITDYVRGETYYQMLADLPPGVEEATGVDVEKRALDQAQREAFWRAVDARLKDDKERLVVHYSYVVGFKPSELYRHRAEAFSDVNEIYRIKENVLARLRRDDELQDLLTSYA